MLHKKEIENILNLTENEIKFCIKHCSEKFNEIKKAKFIGFEISAKKEFIFVFEIDGKQAYFLEDEFLLPDQIIINHIIDRFNIDTKLIECNKIRKEGINYYEFKFNIESISMSESIKMCLIDIKYSIKIPCDLIEHHDLKDITFHILNALQGGIS